MIEVKYKILITMKHRESLKSIYKNLLDAYGPQEWWPAESNFEVIIGAILVQNVSWKNAKIAIESVKSKGLLNPDSLYKIDEKSLSTMIRSSRFYNQKATKIKNFVNHLYKHHNGLLDNLFTGNADEIRKELLGIKGIGKETADCILLYAGNKLSFPSDAYTKRIMSRYGLIPADSNYNEMRKYFMENIDQNLYIYNEFHALIDHHGNRTCKSVPQCLECPIKKISNEIFCRSHYEVEAEK